jgi:allantoinase
MSTDLIIHNGIVVTDTSVEHLDIAVHEGRIVQIAPSIEESASQQIDATNLHIFPGVIDAHLHFNDPGRAHWEGFATGSRACAAGGTTLYFDMPLNSHPPVTDAAAFDVKLRSAEAQSLVDFAFWGGLVPGNVERLDELAERGVVGFKAFMSNSGIEDFPSVDDLTLYEGMARAAGLGLPVAVHAENDTVTSALAQHAIGEGRTGIRDYLRSRPVIAELEAIQRAILFAQETGCSLHVVHVSSGRGVAMVAEARSRGVDVTCETCPHYLVLTDDDVVRLGAVAKCAPPLRSQEEQDAIWAHIFNGNLPMVASDHSPSPPDMKLGEDFFKVWGGISGCQSLLPLVLTDGHIKRKLPLTTIASITSAYPAERFGVSPAKGHIEVDADADLVIVDLGSSATLEAGDILYRHKQSPYIGMRLHGRIVRTIVRGKTVFQDGKAVSAPVGRLVTPRYTRRKGTPTHAYRASRSD